MDFINTLEHRISISKDGKEVVKRPGPFEATGGEADSFKKVPGVVSASSDEGQAWLDAHPDAEVTGDGAQIARRARAAAFGAEARAGMAIENRRAIGDDAAPGGPASGVNTAAGDRPIDPSLQTTETEADALRHGVDLSGEPPVGPVGPSGETLADITPGSAPGPAEAAAADAQAGAPLASTPIPTRSGLGAGAGAGDDGVNPDTYATPGTLPEDADVEWLTKTFDAEQLAQLAEDREVAKTGTKAEVAERVLEADKAARA